MSLKTIIASVTLVLSVAPEVGADWEKIQETEAGDFYTSVDSTNVSANQLVVYFRTEQHCAPQIVIFDYYEIEPGKTEAWDDLQNQRFDSVVSLNRVTSNSVLDSVKSKGVIGFSYEQGDGDAFLGVSTIEFLPDPEVVKSFYKSEGLSVRFHAPNGEWSRSHDYALTGATEPLKAAELACKREVAQSAQPNTMPRMVTLGGRTLFYL